MTPPKPRTTKRKEKERKLYARGYTDQSSRAEFYSSRSYHGTKYTPVRPIYPSTHRASISGHASFNKHEYCSYPQMLERAPIKCGTSGALGRLNRLTWLTHWVCETWYLTVSATWWGRSICHNIRNMQHSIRCRFSIILLLLLLLSPPLESAMAVRLVYGWLRYVMLLHRWVSGREGGCSWSSNEEYNGCRLGDCVELRIYYIPRRRS